MKRILVLGCVACLAAIGAVILRFDGRVLASGVGVRSDATRGVVQVSFRRDADPVLLSVWVNDAPFIRDVPVTPERYWSVALASESVGSVGAHARIRVEAHRSDGVRERTERSAIVRPLLMVPMPSLAGADDAVRMTAPDLSASPDQCAPVAVADALIWLAKQSSQDDRISVSPQTTIDELAESMHWVPGDGVRFDALARGSSQWIKEKGLTVEVRTLRGAPQDVVIDGTTARNRGHAVLFQLQVRDARGGIHGSHLVFVQQVVPRAEGGAWVTVHDPLSPLGSDVYQVSSDGTLEQYPYLAGRMAIMGGIVYALRGTMVP